MTGPSVNDRDLELVFRADEWRLYGIALLLTFFAFLPLTSLHELITTGTIDLEAVGKGRREIPRWILYLVAWSTFVPFLWVFGPYLRYFWVREMFRLNEHGIVIGGKELAPDEVLGFRYSFLRGYVLHSTRGDFSINPRISEGAVDALAKAFPHVAPPT